MSVTVWDSVHQMAEQIETSKKRRIKKKEKKLQSSSQELYEAQQKRYDMAFRGSAVYYFSLISVHMNSIFMVMKMENPWWRLVVHMKKYPSPQGQQSPKKYMKSTKYLFIYIYIFFAV